MPILFASQKARTIANMLWNQYNAEEQYWHEDHPLPLTLFIKTNHYVQTLSRPMHKSGL